MVRVKHRYLLVQLIPENSKRSTISGGSRRSDSFLEVHLYKRIKDVILETHGDFGLASVQKYLKVNYANPYTNIAIIRTKRGTQRMVSSALAMLTMVNNVRVAVNTLHVSGTIRSVQKFLTKYHQRQIPELLKDCKTDQEKAAVLAAIAKSNELPFGKAKNEDYIKLDEDSDLDIFDK